MRCGAFSTRNYLQLLSFFFLCFSATCAYGLFLDDAQTIRFNGRIYNRATFATQNAAGNTRLQTAYNSFNLLQCRTFVQLEMRQNLIDLIKVDYPVNRRS